MADTPAQDRKAGLPRTQIGNRWFTKYDPQLALDIVVQISEGKTLSSICSVDGMPAVSTFQRWVANEPELRKAYQAAREMSAYSFEDKALDTAEVMLADPGSMMRLRAAALLIEQLKWSASRRNPRDYGDRGNQSIVVPINITTSLDMGDANTVKSTIQGSDVYTVELSKIAEHNPIEGEFKEIDEKPVQPKRDPHAPRKRVLSPRVGNDGEYVRPADTGYKERKNKRDRERNARKKKEGAINGEPV